MKVVFVGSGDLACPAIDAIRAAPDLDLSSVVTQPDRPAGRRRQMTPCPAKRLAEERGIPVYSPEHIGSGSFREALEDLRPDLLIVADYGQYIPRGLTECPPLGAINIHPSLLPRWRGAAPMRRAIEAGDSVTGVTILFVSEEMDAGDILLQEETPLGPEETILELEPRLAGLGARLIVEAARQLRDGAADPKPQDNARATWAPKLDKKEGWIDWTQEAAVLHNRVRAFLEWPGSACFAPDGVRVKIWATRVENGEGAPGEVLDLSRDGPRVAAGRGALRILKIQPAGRNPVSGAAFCHGFRLRPGQRFTEFRGDGPEWKTRSVRRDERR